ncbi:MAG: hypothetical protein ACKVY0_29480 [Prosthecobacter sp.]|uniref:hypothetical protein n=1 Tax=Prosthecobacter sp. TaxID=1965333 RepID=UPI00390101BD
MNAKHTIITVFAAFAVVSATDYLIHQVILKADYLATKSLWRSPAEMKLLFNWILVAELMAAAGLTVVWVNAFAATARPADAFRFGLFAGLLASAYAPMFHAVMPIPGLLCVKWVIFGVLQCILVSFVLYELARPRQSGVIRR